MPAAHPGSQVGAVAPADVLTGQRVRTCAFLATGIVKPASREHLVDLISRPAVIPVHHGFMVAPAPDKPSLLNFRALRRLVVES